MSEKPIEIIKGPFFYENWRLAIGNAELKEVLEYPLYTDAHITGEIRNDCGPYHLLNTIPIPPDKEKLLPAIILRIDIYDDESGISLEKTDVSRYHGGGISDEISALLSICLGIRAKAEGISRYFDNGADPKGNPRGPRSEKELFLNKPFGNTKILKTAVGTHSLNGDYPLKEIMKLNPQEAVTLVRAARFYQEAIWIVESAPELSWILFVSAIETAASYWYSFKHSKAEILYDAKPKFVERLKNFGNDDLVDLVANEFSDNLNALKKFLDFIINFLPAPPTVRPKMDQVNWEHKEMKKTLGKIYDWRSRALHGGIPFPKPMCEPPFHLREKPMGLATGTMGGIWVSKDTPMLLHMFEYIVRGAILNWWKSMII